MVYSTATHQDLYDYTIKAFNTAWKYRFPTFILGDGYQAKMRESLVMYDPELRGIKMIPTEPVLGKPGTPGVDRPPSHIRNTYNTEEELYDIIMSYAEEYARISPEIIEYDIQNCDDADVVLISHGVVSRAALGAMKELRAAGQKVGYFRPITLRPFPVDQLKEVAGKTKKLLVIESAYGQLLKLVRENLYGITTPIETLLKPGVGITAEEVIQKVKTL